MAAVTLLDLNQVLLKDLHHQELKLEELFGSLLILTALDMTDRTALKPEEKPLKKLLMHVAEETTDPIETLATELGFISKDVAILHSMPKEYQEDGLTDLVTVKEKTAIGLLSIQFVQDTVAEPMTAQDLILNKLHQTADQDGEPIELIILGEFG